MVKTARLWQSASLPSRGALLLWLVLLVESVYPDTTLRMGTGPPQGTYRLVGESLRQLITRSNPQFTVELVETNGSAENLAMLGQGSIDLALVQTDMLRVALEQARQAGRPVSYKVVLVLIAEPVQVVVAPRVSLDTIPAILGHRVAFGRRGTGTYFTATRITQILKLSPVSEVPVHSADGIYEALRQGTADVGFFITTVPTPQVAALLSDPGFRLLGFDTRAIRQMKNLAPEYGVVSIPEHTYPLQSKPFVTLGVATALVCRPDLDSQTVYQIVQAILLDVVSPESALRRARRGVDIASVIRLNRESSLPFHPASEKTLQEIPPRLWLRAYVEWFQWGLLLLLSSGVVFIARLQSFRHRMFILLINRLRIPQFLVGLLRPIMYHKLVWTLISAFSSLCLVWLVGSAYMYWCEREINVHFVSLRYSSLSILVYLFSGLEDRQPVTTSGWIGSFLMLIVGLVVAAYLTGHFASYIHRYTTEVIQMSHNASKHGILIIGWNERAERIIREIFSGFESGLSMHTITVLTEKPVPPSSLIHEFESAGVTFLSGSSFDKRVLERIGAHEAHEVLVLADEDVEDPDGKSALTVLALKSLVEERNPREAPYIVVEVLNHRKMSLIRDAGANDVICHQDYGIGILAQSIFYHEVSEIFNQLLTYGGSSCEIYVLSTADNEGHHTDISAAEWEAHFEGKTFSEACDYFIDHRNTNNPVILLGVQRPGRNGPEVHLNPRGEFRLLKGDCLIVMAWKRPQLRHRHDKGHRGRNASPSAHSSQAAVHHTEGSLSRD